MKEVDFNRYLTEITASIAKGAFVTVKSGNNLNTMTIGWGSIGYIWNKPIFTVLVRKSRYTYDLIEQADHFTVSIPLVGTLKKELAFCGSKSGRDYDKFKECSLLAIPGIKVETPVIGGCKFHYECSIVFKQAMSPVELNPEYDQQWYQDKDYHTIYYGEILASYLDPTV